MTKKSFYLTLNILNILLGLYVYAMMYSYLFLTLDNWVFGFSIFFLIILMKFFILYILFNLVKKYFSDFTLSKIAEELKTNNLYKEKALVLALVLAFVYDITLILLFTFIRAVIMNFIDWSYIFKGYYIFDLCSFAFAYEIFLLGGVLMFYLSTFCLWKIEDKIKDFYNKKRLNNKTK